MADECTLIFGCVNPINPRAAFFGIARTCGTQHENRCTTTPSIKDRHRGMHQADIGMKRHAHRLFGDFGIALRNGDRMFFMQANQHLWIAIAEIIHH